MSNFLYFGLIVILIGLGSCANEEVSTDVVSANDEHIAPRDSIDSGVYIHSIEYIKIVDLVTPSKVSVYLKGINDSSAEALYKQYDRAYLKMSVNNIVGNLSFEIDGEFKKVTFYRSSPFIGMTDNEIHGVLKEARLVLTNGSTEIVINGSERIIETTVSKVRQGKVPVDD